MQQPRNTTKLYRLPPNVIYFLFYCKSNLFFIFLNKNKHKMIYKNIISDYFCTTKQKMWHTRRNRILFVSVRIHYFLYRNKSLMYA